MLPIRRTPKPTDTFETVNWEVLFVLKNTSKRKCRCSTWPLIVWLLTKVDAPFLSYDICIFCSFALLFLFIFTIFHLRNYFRYARVAASAPVSERSVKLRKTKRLTGPTSLKFIRLLRVVFSSQQRLNRRAVNAVQWRHSLPENWVVILIGWLSKHSHNYV